MYVSLFAKSLIVITITTANVSVEKKCHQMLSEVFCSSEVRELGLGKKTLEKASRKMKSSNFLVTERL